MGQIVAVPAGNIGKLIKLVNAAGTVNEVLDLAWKVHTEAKVVEVRLPGLFSSIFDPHSLQRREGAKQVHESIDALDSAVSQFKKDNPRGSEAPVNREPLTTAIANVQSTIDVLSTFYPDDKQMQESIANFYDEVGKFSHPIDNAIQGLRDLAPSLKMDWKRIRKWAIIIGALTVGGIILILAINKRL